MAPLSPPPTLLETQRQHAYSPLAVSDGDGKAASRSPPAQRRTPQPPRWRTREFAVYAAVFAIALPVMVWIPVQLSSPSHPNYWRYQSRLSDGWIWGRKIDNSDHQYRSFRDNVPLLTLIAALHTLPSRLISRVRPALRRPYTLFWCIAFLLGLHGAAAIFPLALLAANYTLARTLGGTRAAVPAIWAWNVLTLFANDWLDGYRFAAVGLGKLDNHRGIMRWNVFFNITMLRLVSFSIDYHWAVQASRKSSEPPVSSSASPTDSPPNHRERVATPHAPEDYSLANFIIHALYPPLYIAGPIMTFNDYLSQLKRPQSSSPKNVALYALRFAACLLAMELILHFMHVVAIKDASAWQGDTPAQLSMIGFWNLIVVWLKLLLPWRFFRLWALADGVEPPENMIRCVANNYSILGFWRAWHRSYNLWVVRYIYVPLGGTKNAIWSTALVFTFVALWHDLTLRLLTWGWLISVFVLPEMAASRVLPASKYSSRPWYRHVCALGGVLNVLAMMAANLVGFVLGTDGTRYLVHELAGTWQGARFMLVAAACLFVGVQVMFEYREEELRRGIWRRC